jgi:hypothetical protein
MGGCVQWGYAPVYLQLIFAELWDWPWMITYGVKYIKRTLEERKSLKIMKSKDEADKPSDNNDDTKLQIFLIYLRELAVNM